MQELFQIDTPFGNFIYAIVHGVSGNKLGCVGSLKMWRIFSSLGKWAMGWAMGPVRPCVCSTCNPPSQHRLLYVVAGRRRPLRTSLGRLFFVVETSQIHTKRTPAGFGENEWVNKKTAHSICDNVCPAKHTPPKQFALHAGRKEEGSPRSLGWPGTGFAKAKKQRD